MGIFTHKLCRRKWGRARNKEEKEEKWRMKRVKRKAMVREVNKGRRRMGQQHTDVTFCVTFFFLFAFLNTQEKSWRNKFQTRLFFK